MNHHLSKQQISAWISGERTPEEELHIAGCPQCRGEVAGLEDAVAFFRGAMHEWGSREPLARWQPEPAPRRSRIQPARWALLAATLMILAAVPLYRNVERQRAADRARADALLMEQVDAGLSRPVPAPMEPLLNLVPGDIR